MRINRKGDGTVTYYECGWRQTRQRPLGHPCTAWAFLASLAHTALL